MDFKNLILKTVKTSNLSADQKRKVLNKIASSGPKIIGVNKSININSKEYNNLSELSTVFKELLADNDNNVDTNTQNNSNYAVQNKSFNVVSENSKTANKMKSGARNLSGSSTGQTNYSDVNPNMFSQKAQPTKIGNGIDTGLAKKFITLFTDIIIGIIILEVVYYLLVKYLGMSVSIG